jgi:hypothetical protein
LKRSKSCSHQKPPAAELGVDFSVVAPNAHKTHEALADLANDLSVYAHAAAGNALHHDSHRRQQSEK